MTIQCHIFLRGLVVFMFAAPFLRGGMVASWGGAGSPAPGGIALDGSNNMYVVGGYTGTVDFDPGPGVSNHAANGIRNAFFSKFSPNGTWLWTKTWGGTNDDRANSVVVFGTNVYVAGCFQDTVDFNPGGTADLRVGPRGTNGLPNNEAFLCKYDSNGNYKWVRTWGGNGGDEAYQVRVDGTGNVYVCGDFSSTNLDLSTVGATGVLTNNGRWDAFIFKFDANGTNLWAKTWGGPCYDDCTCIAVDAAGNVYGGGMFASPTADFDPGPGTNNLHANNPGTDWGLVDVFLTKLDANGNFQWARSWGESNDWDAAQGVSLDAAGSNVYVSGYFAYTVDFNPLGAASNITTHGGVDAYLCKYDANGIFKWARTWGGTNNDYARGNVVDGAGYVYVMGDIQSTNVDFDPGNGVDTHSTQGGRDISLSKFDSDGNFILARTCGGVGDDTAYGGVVADAAGNVYTIGTFTGPVDFSPLIGGTTNVAMHGTTDAYLAQIPTCYKMTVVKSGNGVSSAGAGLCATQYISLNITTQIVFTAADWCRIQALASNQVAIGAAAGRKAYTQALVRVATDQSNDVSFAVASPTQTGYTNVPTSWLTNWFESAVISDAVFSVYDKYLIGLNPTTSNTFALRIESFSVSGTNVITLLKRTYTGGLSPDGMHGQLELQGALTPGSTFTNVASTAVTGASVFDGNGRKTYTNTTEGALHLIRAVIQ